MSNTTQLSEKKNKNAKFEAKLSKIMHSLNLLLHTHKKKLTVFHPSSMRNANHTKQIQIDKQNKEKTKPVYNIDKIEVFKTNY